MHGIGSHMGCVPLITHHMLVHGKWWWLVNVACHYSSYWWHNATCNCPKVERVKTSATFCRLHSSGTIFSLNQEEFCIYSGVSSKTNSTMNGLNKSHYYDYLLFLPTAVPLLSEVTKSTRCINAGLPFMGEISPVGLLYRNYRSSRIRGYLHSLRL